MSTAAANKILFELSEKDHQIVVLHSKRSELEESRERFVGELSEAKEMLSRLEQELEESSARQSMDEGRLKDEEARIIDRRKQLTGIGGAKAAKLVEREIDIAAKSMEALESRVLDSVGEVERLESQVAELREKVEEMEAQFEEEEPGRQKDLKGIDKEVGSLSTSRDKVINKLDARLKALYVRVSSRYPGDAVAVAKAGACRSCYRALPPQTYNQVMAGNSLLQCPGCSRILVFGGE